MATLSIRPAVLSLSLLLLVMVLAAGCKNETIVAADTTVPTVSILWPHQGAVVRQTDTVVVEASDNRGITKVELLLNGQVSATSQERQGPWAFVWNTENFADGNYTLTARAYDAADNVGSSSAVSVKVLNAFLVRVENTLFTDLVVIVAGQTRTIAPDGYTTFVLTTNPRTLNFSAETSGKTTQGTQIGRKILWSASYNVSSAWGDTIIPVVSSNYFFIYMQNRGNTTLGPLHVNTQSSTEHTTDNISIPKSLTITYSIGYYRAFSNTQVRAYWSNPTTTYSYWTHGVHFSLPNTINQSATLLNTIPTSSIQSDASSPSFEIPSGIQRETARVGTVHAQRRARILVSNGEREEGRR